MPLNTAPPFSRAAPRICPPVTGTVGSAAHAPIAIEKIAANRMRRVFHDRDCRARVRPADNELEVIGFNGSAYVGGVNRVAVVVLPVSADASDATGTVRFWSCPFSNHYRLTLETFRKHKLPNPIALALTDSPAWSLRWMDVEGLACGPETCDAIAVSKVRITRKSYKWTSFGSLSGDFIIEFKDGRRLEGSFKAKGIKPPPATALNVTAPRDQLPAAGKYWFNEDAVSISSDRGRCGKWHKSLPSPSRTHKIQRMENAESGLGDMHHK